MGLCPICSGERSAEVPSASARGSVPRGRGCPEEGLGGGLGTAPSPPLPAGCFSVALLPAHASRCGEDDSDSDVEQPSSPGARVPCPICELRFSPAEVERHASTCGE